VDGDYRHDGATEQALAAFEDARRLAPDDWRPAVAAAALLLSRRPPDPAGAEQLLAPFLDGPHASAEARFHQGLAREAAADPAGAAAAFTSALDLDPGHVPSLCDLALLRQRSGDVTGALALLRRAKRSTAPDEESLQRALDRRIESLSNPTPAAAH